MVRRSLAGRLHGSVAQPPKTLRGEFGLFYDAKKVRNTQSVLESTEGVDESENEGYNVNQAPQLFRLALVREIECYKWAATGGRHARNSIESEALMSSAAVLN